jgi:D-threo-aldose 1-dehydrogenase
LGKALAGVPRENYVLATKVGRLLDEEPIGFDYSRDSVLRNLEDSLNRLQVDAVDIVHIHVPDNHDKSALEEAFPALADLRSQGVIKAIGSGMNQWQMLKDFATHADFDCFLLAGRFTLLEQTSLDFLELCRQKNIAVILGGVYNSGVLASDLQPSAQYNYANAPSDILEKAKQLAQVCQRHGVPLNVAAAQFPYLHPAVTTIVMGADAPDQVTANLAALQQEVPPQLWSELQQEGLVSDRLDLPDA